MHITAGKFKNRQLASPKGEGTRPTTTQLRQAVFNICRFALEEAHFLDICAGSGAVGLEALSQGARLTTFIENDPKARHSIQANIEKLQVRDCTRLYFGTALKMLERLKKEEAKFNIIYIDPPYYTLEDRKVQSTEILEFVDQSGLLLENGLVFVEETAQYKRPEPVLKALKKESSRTFGGSQLDLYRFEST
ncbi:MAG: yhhF [Chlamydiales bacterium]|jgi:16S rRNA (guanine(966)-N(2))-methyltransferase RsmD|nr:yhhF [Chlamydiales bacterium]